MTAGLIRRDGQSALRRTPTAFKPLFRCQNPVGIYPLDFFCRAPQMRWFEIEKHAMSTLTEMAIGQDHLRSRKVLFLAATNLLKACMPNITVKVRYWGIASVLLTQCLLPKCDAATTAVVAWGYSQPTAPSWLTNTVAVAASANLALRADGTVISWGTLSAPNLTDVVAIAAGGDHALALKSNGTITAWGSYFVTGGGSMSAFVPAGLSNVVAVAAGANHDVALKADGTVAVWGSPAYVASPPADLSNVVSIAAGGGQNLALLSNGTVRTWGSMSVYSVPDQLSDVVAIRANYYNFAAVKRDHSIILWGNNEYGQLNPPVTLGSNLISIECGARCYLAVQDDGSMIGWGQNYFGQTMPPTSPNPVTAISSDGGHCLAITTQAGPTIVQQPYSFTAYTGRNTNLSVRVRGSLPLAYQWQFNGTNNIPGATNVSLPLNNLGLADAGPYRVVIANGFGAVTSSVAMLSVEESSPILTQAPSDQTVSLTRSAQFTVGADGSGPLHYQWRFQGSDLPGTTNSTLQLSSVTPANAGSYAVRVSNVFGSIESPAAKLTVVNVLAWGDDSMGKTTIPSAATNVVAVAGGQDHSLALKADGSVLVWGDGSLGQTNIPSAATNIVAIASAVNHCLSLRADGQVVAWGANDYGQNLVPAQATNVVQVADGGYHCLALRADGSVISWGNNDYGQSTIPSGATNVVAVAAGAIHSLVLRQDKTVLAWGDSFLYQTNVPAGLTNVTSIVAGSAHNLALLQSGLVIGWGYDTFGQADAPASLTNVIALAAGQNVSIALRSDGAITGWGSGWYEEQNPPPGYTNVTAIAAGSFHALAVVSWPTKIVLDPTGCGFAPTNGAFRVRIRGLSGNRPVVLSASADLVNWGPIVTNSPISDTMDIVDPSATNAPIRYYRVFQQ